MATAVAEVILEDTVNSLEDDLIPVLDDMILDCAPYVSRSRLSELRRAIEILDDFRGYVAELVAALDV
jgi:hypothetical protein